MSDGDGGFDPRDVLIDEDAPSVAERAKNLVPWLPDPHQCDECGAYCDATHEYVAEQAMQVDIWKCPECESRYYRDRV